MMSGMTSLRPGAAASTARAETTSAASLPARMAPSIEPRNFWDVKQPQSEKLSMGDFWLGRYLFLPGIAAYTERGTRTTADFLSLAPSGNSGNAPPSKVRGFIVPGYWGSDAISVGNKRANSPIVAWIISSSLLAIQFVSPPAMGEQGANTNSNILLSSSAYSLHVVDMSA